MIGARGMALMLLGAVALVGCGPAPGPGEDAAPLAGRDCVVIVLDALHADHLGCYGGPPGTSPNIDALAAAGVRFARVWSQASWTLPSTVSLFTGLFSQTHGVSPAAGADGQGDAGGPGLALTDEARTLPELFAAAGYDTRMFTQNPFASGVYGLAQGVEGYHEVRSEGLSLGDQVAADLARRDDRPLFAYLHFRRPHSPFDAEPEFAEGLVPPGPAGPADGSNASIEDYNARRVTWSPDDLARHVALYHANIRQVDAEVGRLLAALDPERTLVVLLSDHGEAFGQHQKLGHNWHSYEEFVHIPLVLRGPGLPAGRVVDAPVMSIDVLPTLVQWFGLETPVPAPQGRSLAGLVAGAAPTPRLVFTSSRPDLAGVSFQAVSDGRFKLIRRVPDGQAWLYDLASDPGEQRDLATTAPDVAARLERALDDWAGSQQPLLDQDGVELDEATRERLRALGYVLDGR